MIAKLNGRPKDGRPLSGGNEYQIATDLVEIVGEIAGILEQITVRLQTGKSAVTPAGEGDDRFPSAVEASRQPSIPRNGETEIVAATAQTAGEAMTTVAASGGDPEIVEIVRSFREGLTSASEQIQVLSDYKTLHDELHNLEFHCYTGIVRDSKHFTEDEEAADNLIVYERDLDARIHQMRAISEQAGFPPHEIQWLDTLSEAHTCLREAIDQGDPKRAEEARMLLNRVLSAEPIKINDRLLRRSNRLDLNEIGRASCRERVL